MNTTANSIPILSELLNRNQTEQAASIQFATGFEPHWLATSAFVQGLLSRRVPKDLLTAQLVRPLLVDAGKDFTGKAADGRARLLSYYAPSLSPTGSRGLVLLLHGWEGCSHSVYNLVMGDAFLRAGYAICQLNLRDHGPGLHFNPKALNPGIFNGTLLDEVVAAVQQIAQLAGDTPFYIVGASMGGSFATRLALRHSETPFHNLQRVVAICPALNPDHATAAIDRHPVFRRYFRDRWFDSLQEKQRLFPDLYDFSPMATMPMIRQMTDWWVPRYTDHATTADYYQGYTVGPTAFRNLAVPLTLLTAQNDGVIPVTDFYAIEPHPLLDIQIHRTGGHVGFIDLFPFRHTLPQLVLPLIQNHHTAKTNGK